ncbi:glycosyltransferase [Cohnella lubricantis]|uniref:Glycosyltransferase n=1 Tax=Cohnella lubricantis TaxID=2163172 RepID=A0A841TF04_9BACL|nr:glycosyltransferase [Cohnella lubricantis]MBB6678665.1 glycosyltransferase [Cohnella lubricantis]MBP2119175.1 processive 1,2-diacylglycerol beta-glucosyltransferase [Cohnella lubricantis]
MREIARRTSALRIIIVYASFGDGHRQAALALQQSFSSLGAANIVLLDLMAEAHPILNEFSRYFYMKSYTLWPQVYGWMYQATRCMKPNSLFAHWLHSWGADTLRRLIEKERPDAIVHTFPMLVLPSIARRIQRPIPMYNVVTDFDLHMRWVHPKIDKYYVATDDLRDELARTGIPPARIAATGIPLRSTFSMPRRLEREAERFGFDPEQPVVLVMCGAYGARSGLGELCRRLASAGRTQVALVCGRNRALEAAFRERFNTDGSRVRVFGYVESIHELMSIASCIVTKPGGLTLTEAMQARLPIFLYRPMPGQELNNARYLAAKGAAVICRTPGALAAEIESTLESPGRRSAMQSAIDTLRKEGAADRIALDILQNLPIL